MKKTFVISACLLMSGMSASAQGIVVNKTDGTKVEFTAEEVESITTFGYEETQLADLTISETTVSLENGGNTSVEILTGNGEYAVVSNNPEIATAELSENIIVITAFAVGNTIINVTDTQSEQSVEIEITVNEKTPPVDYGCCPDGNHPHMIDLGIGVKWACCNVGATSPEDFGGYYAWGETEEKDYYGPSTYLYAQVDFNGIWFDEATHLLYEPTLLESNISNTDYDVAKVKWGSSWRMPTTDDMRTLWYQTRHQWLSINGINGLKFTGSNGNYVFFPAAGSKYSNITSLENTRIHYWTASYLENSNAVEFARIISFQRNSQNYWDYFISNTQKYKGLSVRPVSE